MVTNKTTAKTDEMTWWAYSEKHGWVILDKTLPQNRNSFDPEGFTFIRCSDWNEYEQGEQTWNYREAGRYLDTLTPAAAAEARRELETLQTRYAGEH